MLKKKYADQRNIKAIKDKKFKKIRIKNDEFISSVALTIINKVSIKWEVPRDNEQSETILDNGYKWIVIYPKNEKYTITAIYDQNLELVEFYFDTAKKIYPKANVPYIKDLYLDIVLTRKNEVIYLDDDELKTALKKSKIRQKDYDLAKRTADRIVSKYHRPEEFEKLKELTLKYINEILESNENKQKEKPKKEKITKEKPKKEKTKKEKARKEKSKEIAEDTEKQ